MKGLLGFLFLLSPVIILLVWIGLTWLLWKGGRRFFRSGQFPVAVRIVLIVAVAVAWFGWSFWEAGGKKMYWDAKVWELCAIDGGVRVFETVELPAEKFNKWGQINFYQPNQGENALGPKYLVKDETLFLRAETKNPTLVRHCFQVFRRSDGKLLGERIAYGRGGGDFPGPWHPSSFSCPNPSEGGLLKVLFTKIDSKGEGHE